MSTTPINLNRVRKARARDATKKKADENAVKHGRTKADRQAEAARQALVDKRLEGHGREDD
ncbi:DUF4169 family protein [Rhodobacteraceae bacterium N5(2021)]|uniref:DUF4169 family protein n=1 Tax=Gymnodinialimonas phycosphaerae TaxID=2841589 RepID=A0A975TYI4_9RHOB|nr:DUF4169 family protein [Gymnodinialimonas phycosphaerae]MBY4892263.1 DUF4169 family protein [Gymnodinialimonas phycosphaerae]